MFDPWSATFEEAEAAQKPYVLDGNSPFHPINQWYASIQVDSKRESIEAGDGFSVLACIKLCVTHGLIAPEWLAMEFNKRFDSVLNFESSSWDDPNSFGKPHPKGAHINALRKHRLLRYMIYNEATKLLQDDPKTKIDAHFFERVGSLVHPPVGKTEADRLYYEAKKERENFNAELRRIERYGFKPIIDKRRKYKTTGR